MITSARSPKIQWVRSLQARSKARRDERLFVVEGVRLVEEALQAGALARLVLYSGEIGRREAKLLQGFSAQGCPLEEVSSEVMRHASDTQTPQGILVVLPILPAPIQPGMSFVFIPDEVRDPGNLGTMLRTAAASGVDACLLPPVNVDVYSPKVVRAAMGAHFRLPLHHAGWEEITAMLKEAGLKTFLADAQGEQVYSQADFRAPLALILGGEAEGAGDTARRLADVRVRIPMPGDAESLNAAVAAAILMFEVVRQRGNSISPRSPRAQR
jgi:TrmH family RNA methyltransferase